MKTINPCVADPRLSVFRAEDDVVMQAKKCGHGYFVKKGFWHPSGMRVFLVQISGGGASLTTG
jgi:hypothetical protein